MRSRLGILLVVMVLVAACGDDAGTVDLATTQPGVVTTADDGGEVSTTVAPDQETPVSVAPAVAGEAVVGTLVLLSDDFQDGDAEGWDVESGWYVLGSGSEFLLVSSGAA